MTKAPSPKILNFIRHAPSQPAGYLYGRTDADIGCIESSVAKKLHELIGPVGLVLSSPAKRCQKTCDSILSPDHDRLTIDNLWEQSFGTWDGLGFSELPDIGVLADDALATFAAPDGESFVDLSNRVQSTLIELCQTRTEEQLTFFVHAGVIRAALALAFCNHSAALKCEIDTLSLTRLRYLGEHGFSVMTVNQTVK